MPGGDPDGLRTIEKSNWSGSGFVVPRALVAKARDRKELDRTGVYVLIGPPEESGLPRAYVGEGDPIRPRLEQHDSKKDFWTHCVTFTSKDENLNKAHVQYLEARLVKLATEAKRCVLDNGNAPQLPSLSESDAADAEGFLAEMLLCFPILGIGMFTVPKAEVQSYEALFLKARGVEATGVDLPEGFMVFSGSHAATDETPGCHPFLKELRATLVNNGVIKPSNRDYVFTQHYTFSSPSSASGVVLGRASNGRFEWKTKDGKPLKEIQDAPASGQNEKVM